MYPPVFCLQSGRSCGTVLLSLVAETNTQMSKWKRLRQKLSPVPSFKGTWSESHLCIDCGFDTAPGILCRTDAEKEAARQIAAGIHKWVIPTHINNKSEVYMVYDHVWERAGVEGYGGCLCIGCLEKRIGRPLIPDDFDKEHPFFHLPGTYRLLNRRGG